VSRPAYLRISHTGEKGCGQGWSNPGHFIRPPARRIGPMPGHDPPVKGQNLGHQHPQLHAECNHAGTRCFGSRRSGSAAISSNSSTPWRPTRAAIPNSLTIPLSRELSCWPSFAVVLDMVLRGFIAVEDRALCVAVRDLRVVSC
jgi:hypothetical protein